MLVSNESSEEYPIGRYASASAYTAQIRLSSATSATEFS